jgi:hypothetical protein
MDQRLLFGLGVSFISMFGRWVFPTIPKPIAWAGLAAGVSLIVLSNFPQIRVGPAILGITGLVAIIAAVAWQRTAPIVPAPAMPLTHSAKPKVAAALPVNATVTKITVGRSHPLLGGKSAREILGGNRQDSDILRGRFGKDDQAEQSRRTTVLGKITALYIANHDGISSRMMVGLELPPAEFLNAELEKQGETWRVRSVQGPKAETYEIK